VDSVETFGSPTDPAMSAPTRPRTRTRRPGGGREMILARLRPYNLAAGLLHLAQAIAVMEQELESCEEVEHLLRFLRNAERGICRGRRDTGE